MTTVRAQILAQLIDALEALEEVGDVLEPVEEYFADRDELAGAYSAVLDDGKLVVELTALSDVSIDREGIGAGLNAEAFRFDVVLLAVVPASFIGEDERPLELAARVDALLGSTYRGLDKMTFGGLARHAYRLGGGGIATVPDTDLVGVEHALTITYRHAHGNPEVVV